MTAGALPEVDPLWGELTAVEHLRFHGAVRNPVCKLICNLSTGPCQAKECARDSVSQLFHARLYSQKLASLAFDIFCRRFLLFHFAGHPFVLFSGLAFPLFHGSSFPSLVFIPSSLSKQMQNLLK